MIHPLTRARDGYKTGRPPEDFVKITGQETNLAPGAQHVFNLSGLPDVKEGLVAHIAYLRLLVTVTFSTATASMTAAANGYDLLTFLGNVNLRVARHDHIRGLDAETIHFLLGAGHNWRRGSRNFNVIAADLPDADASGLSRTLELFIPLVNRNAPESMRYDNAIPADMFNRGATDKSQFSVQVQPTSPESAPGVTCTATTAATLEVGLVYLDYINQPTCWELKEERDSKKVKNLQSKGAFQALAIHNRRDMAVAETHSAYDFRSMSLDGTQLWEQPRTATDIMEGLGARSNEVGPSWSLAAWRTTVPYVPLIWPEQGDFRISRMPAGQLRLEITTRPGTFDDDRIIYHDTGVRTPEYDRVFRAEMGIPGENAPDQVTQIGAARGGGGPLGPFLPARILTPGSKARIVASRAAKKMGPQG